MSLSGLGEIIKGLPKEEKLKALEFAKAKNDQVALDSVFILKVGVAFIVTLILYGVMN